MTHDIIIEVINLRVDQMNPIGESNEDEKRLSNLMARQAVTYKYNRAVSIKVIGK